MVDKQNDAEIHDGESRHNNGKCTRKTNNIKLTQAWMNQRPKVYSRIELDLVLMQAIIQFQAWK